MKGKYVLESKQFKLSHFKGILVLMMLLTLVLAACQSATPEPTVISIPTEPPATESPALEPAVSVSEQEVFGNEIAVKPAIGGSWLNAGQLEGRRPNCLCSLQVELEADEATTLLQVTPKLPVELAEWSATVCAQRLFGLRVFRNLDALQRADESGELFCQLGAGWICWCARLPDHRKFAGKPARD